MTETLEETIWNGFYGWKSNPVLGLPYLAASILSLVFAGVPMGLIAFVALQKTYASALSLNNPSVILLGFIAASVICFFLMLLTCSFFISAALGMAVKTAKGESVSVAEIYSLGKKKALSVFLASLFILAVFVLSTALLVALAWVFLISKMVNLFAFTSFAGLAFYLFYVPLYIFISLPVYSAIVAGDLGGFEGIRAGLSFALKNKIKVFFLFAVFYSLMSAMSLVFNTLTGPFYLLGIILPVLNIVLELVFTTLFILILCVTAVPIYSVWTVRAFLGSTGAVLKQYPSPSSQPRSPERSA